MSHTVNRPHELEGVEEPTTLKGKILARVYESEMEWGCEGTKTTHKDTLHSMWFVYKDEPKLLDDIIDEVGVELLDWLYEYNYLRPSNMTGVGSWQTLIDKFKEMITPKTSIQEITE